MTELADSKEYIAVRQRADAQEKMKALEIKQISLHVSAALIALVCVFGTLGLSLTTVSTLSYYGLLPTIGQIIDTTLPPEPIVEFEVNYYVEDGQGGIIEGEEFQIVAQGETGSLVYAAADEGWAFAGWSDGYAEPYRQEEDVRAIWKFSLCSSRWAERATATASLPTNRPINRASSRATTATATIPIPSSRAAANTSRQSDY